MMLVVFFALHTVFEAGVRAVAVGEEEVRATEQARLGLERMEREIRAAAPYFPPDKDKRHLFFRYEDPGTPTAPRGAGPLAFGNDLDGRCGLRKTLSGGRCGSGVESRELVSYYVNGGGVLIRRSNNLRTPLAGEVEGLDLRYLDPQGNPASLEGEIGLVEITLTVKTGRAEQRLRSNVALRSRAG